MSYINHSFSYLTVDILLSFNKIYLLNTESLECIAGLGCMVEHQSYTDTATASSHTGNVNKIRNVIGKMIGIPYGISCQT